MSMKVVVLAFTVLTALSFASFFLFFNPPAPGMRGLKTSGSRDAAQKILDSWGEDGRAVARRNLAFDWFFIALYTTLWITAGMYLGGWAWVFSAIGVAGTIADLLENRGLWVILHGNTSDSAAALSKTMLPINFSCFVIAAVGLLAVALLKR